MKFFIIAGMSILLLGTSCVSRPLTPEGVVPVNSKAKAFALNNSQTANKLLSDLAFAENCYRNGDYSRALAVSKSVYTRSTPGSETHESARILSAWILKRSGNLTEAMDMLLPTPLPPHSDAHRARLALAADWRAEEGDCLDAANLMRAALSGRGKEEKKLPWENEGRKKLINWEQRLGDEQTKK